MRFRRARDRLRRCPACRSRLVCPIAWQEDGDEHWSIDLHCGECAHRWIEVIHNKRAAHYDIQLDRDEHILRQSLRKLERERMAADIEVFADALARDLVGPADFTR
jgi:hypothetical protein